MDITSAWRETMETTIAPSIPELRHKEALHLSCSSSTAVFYLHLVNRCGISIPIPFLCHPTFISSCLKLLLIPWHKLICQVDLHPRNLWRPLFSMPLSLLHHYISQALQANGGGRMIPLSLTNPLHFLPSVAWRLFIWTGFSPPVWALIGIAFHFHSPTFTPRSISVYFNFHPFDIPIMCSSGPCSLMTPDR